jgi:hypothetical protein
MNDAVFFGDCDTREKALAKFADFTGSVATAEQLIAAYEELKRDYPNICFRYRISGWVN